MRSLALFCTLVLTLAAGAAPISATISGTVTGDTGQPLGGMSVDVYTSAGVLQLSTSSANNGTYSLTVPNGSYRILAYDPAGTFATSFYADAESFETSATLTVSQNLTNINFRLPRAGYAAGHVSAAPNMTVAAYNLSGTRRGFTNTDSTGGFALPLPPGNYKIAAFDPALAYATTFYRNASTFDAAAVVSIASTESVNVDIALPLAAKVSGAITDRTTHAPLASMRVTAYANDGSVAGRATTAADGRYALASRPGALRVVIDDPAGNYATTFVPDAESFSVEEPVSTIAGQTTAVNATMERGGHLTGSVKPVLPMTVVAYNADGTIRAFTIASGAYTLVVPPGDFRLGVFDPALDYLPQSWPSVVHAIAQQTIGSFDFTLIRGARVTGRVTSRATGNVLAAMTVGAYDLTGHLLSSTQTNADGTYALLLAPATVKLLAFDNALHFATAYYLDAQTFDTTAALPLIEGASVTADFALTDAGRISGSVTDATTFAPLAGIAVFAYDPAFRTIAETTTDDTGAFRLALPPGSYSLAAADPTHRYANGTYPGAPIPLTAGQDAGPYAIRLVAAPQSPRRRAVGVASGNST